MERKILPPGDFLSKKLEEKNLSLRDFVKISGINQEFVYEIIQGERKITAHTAKKIAYALGTTTQLWMHLEQQYQKSIR